jgi:tetratricopeptide (TPR) repeat protein
MYLRRQRSFDTSILKQVQILPICIVWILFFSPIFNLFAQNRAPQKPPALIRDTDTAEGKTETEATATKKEHDPVLAEQNINIGNFYFKKRNYDAAIQRYLDAIEYQPDSVRAYEALTRAYEKKGDTAKAISAYKEFIEHNPDSPKSPEFRIRVAKLEKK